MRISRLQLACKAALFAVVVLGAALVSGTAAADGLIVVHDPPGPGTGHFRFAPLEVRYHRVQVEIDDLVATTTVDQEFFNPTGLRLEGTYVFPLPDGAHLDRFSMDVDGKMAEAELLPADTARALYEQIVRTARDPALLEYSGRGAYRARIFPIEPRSRKRITLSYTQILKSDSGLSEYVYTLSTEKFSSAPLEEVSISLTLNGREPLRSVYSPSHEVAVRREGDRRAVVSYREAGARPDTDFKLIFSRTPDPLGIDLRVSRKPGEDGYFMLLASPGLTAPRAGPTAKDMCFVLDTSGSMAGAKLEQAKKALTFCLANLGAEDRFEIVRFSTEAEGLFGSLVAVDPDRLSKAERFVRGLAPIGGTAIGTALDRALALRGLDRSTSTGDRPFIIIFITDGIPTVGETGEDPLVEGIRKAGGSTRIFSFGIGTDVNTHLLDRIASETRAVSQYVLPGEDIEIKVSGFYTKIKEPVLSSIALRFSNPAVRVSDIMPNVLPDLFNGDMLVVFGRYTGQGSSAVRITGTYNGSPHEFQADVDFPAADSSSPFIPRLWATRRVGWMLDEMRLHGESAELKEEVIRLARAFGIVTPYTAYLIMEDELQRQVQAPMRSFQELEADGASSERVRLMMDSVLREAASEKSRSGAPAVMNALAMQDLKGSVNEKQSGQAEGMAKGGSPATAGAGAGYRATLAQNYASQVKFLNGRAFYQNDSVWIDSTAQAERALQQKRIGFGSDQYFALLKRFPHAVQWLSLGSDVDVVLDGTLYQIRQ